MEYITEKQRIIAELQRIASALEAHNEIAQQHTLLLEKCNALFERSMEENEARHRETIALGNRNVKTSETWIQWNIQRAIENEVQMQQISIEQEKDDEAK
jgi:hypothetical protein